MIIGVKFLIACSDHKRKCVLMSEQITLHYQCRLCGKQLDRGIHLGPPSPGTCSKAPKVDGFHGPHRWVIVSLPKSA